MKKEFLDLQGLEYVISELNKKINAIIEQYDGIYNFPSIGNENTAYMDTSSNSIYRWDDKDLKYYRVGFNPDDVELIDGGNSNE